MKRITIFFILLLLSIGLIADDEPTTYNDMKEGITSFAENIANTLPFNSTLGLNWSDAYIGGFPHFGIRGTVGMTTIPFESADIIAKIYDIDLVEKIPGIDKIGFPIPAYTADIRLGGFLLPFDIGAKFGYLPPESKFLLSPNIDADYMLVGGDIRIGILEDGVLLPDLSIGGGVNYLKASIDIADIMEDDFELSELGPYSIAFSNPDVNFYFETTTIDVKAQVSKDILLFTPHAGVGYSYGISKAGGGIKSDILLNGEKITADEIKEIEEYYKEAGKEVPNLTDSGLLVHAEPDPDWALRAFGGVAINLLFIRVDTCVMYNFLSGSYGAAVNLGIQF